MKLLINCSAIFVSNWGKVSTFVVVFDTDTMFIHPFSISFRITCGGELASQFYNPLQKSVSSDKRVRFDGHTARNLARNLLYRN